MVHVVGISGKIGSGKNYLSEQFTKLLVQLGYSVSETTYATPLKDDVTRIIQFVRDNPTATYVAKEAEVTVAEAEKLISIIVPELEETPDLTGWRKTKAVRASLQFYGTEVRRKQDNDYWVKKIDSYVDKSADFVFIPDVRFVNEADWVKDFYLGTLFRLEVPIEIRRERILSRDSLNYSEEAFFHPSETALDEYKRFDSIVGSTYNTEELISPLLGVSQL